MKRLATAHLRYVNEAYVKLHLNVEEKKGSTKRMMQKNKMYGDLDFVESAHKKNEIFWMGFRRLILSHTRLMCDKDTSVTHIFL